MTLPRRCIAPLALASLAALFFAPGIFLGQVPIFRDLLVLVIPLRSYAAEAIGSGRFPLWIPHLFFGAPFFANYQSAVIYPPSAILYLLPLPAGLSLYLALHLFVAGLGMMRYLRSRLGLPEEPAFFGGIVFAFGGFITSLLSLPNQLAVAAWLPWVLEAGEELLARGKPTWFFRLATLLSLQLLAGAPEGVLLTLVLLASRLVAQTLKEGPAATRLPGIAAAGLVAVCISAVQLLPTLEYFLRTNRAGALPFDLVAAESLAPRSLQQLVLPHPFEGGAPGLVPEGGIPLFWSLYLGVAPLVLAAVGLAARPLGFWPVVLVVTTAFALGSNVPVLAIAYRLLPSVIGVFRFPPKFFLLSHFALSVLAAEGMARVWSARRLRLVSAYAAGAIATWGAAVSVWALLDPKQLLEALGYDLRPGLSRAAYEFIAGQASRAGGRVAAFALVAAALFWFFERRRWTLRPFAVLSILVTCLDLLPLHHAPLTFTDWSSLRDSGAPQKLGLEAGERVFHYCTASRGCTPPASPGLGQWLGTVRVLDSVEERGRALWASLVPDAPIVYGLGAVGGTDGLTTRDQEVFFRTLAELPRDGAVHLLAALGVGGLIGPEPLDDRGLRELVARPDPPTWVYATLQAAPRTYLAERMFHTDNLLPALAAVASAGFRPGRDVVLVGETASGIEGVAPGTMRNVSFGPHVVRARVSLPSPGVWVVSDSWFPGWEGRIDGRPAEVLRANGIVRALRVPAGNHEVEMHYSPRSFRLGCWISLASAAVTASVWLFVRWTRAQ